MASFARPAGITAVILAMFAAGAALSARASVKPDPPDIVQLAPGTAVHFATPPFLIKGKRYAITFPGGGPSQTYTVQEIRSDGWVLVQVADDTTRTDLYVPGEFPVRWLHVGLATSIQEMRDLP